MSERIKELAEQAKTYALDAMIKVTDKGHPKGHPLTIYSESYDRKFADLLIKDCISVVEGGSFLHDQAPTAIFAKECSAAIKRHFSVRT